MTIETMLLLAVLTLAIMLGRREKLPVSAEISLTRRSLRRGQRVA
jgi:hypothetical protein